MCGSGKRGRFFLISGRGGVVNGMLSNIKHPSRGKKMLMAVMSFVVLFSVFGFISYGMAQTPVTVVLDGEKQEISAHADTVKELLADLDVDVKQHDVVKPGKNKELTAEMKIVWDPADKVKLVRDGETETLWTTAETVKELAKKQNITVGKHDEIEPGLDEPIQNNLKVTYKAGYQVKLNIAGKDKKVWTTASTTVADLLKQQEVKLDDNDRVKPAKDTIVDKETAINVTRVKKVTDVVEESVDYAVVTKKDASLAKGKEKVLKSGSEGQVAKYYEVILENGKEVSRKLVKTETKEDSKDRVVAVGTKTVSQPSRGSDSSSSANKDSGGSTQQFYVNSTAYTANCSGCSGTTATGVNLKANPNAKVIAVDPSVIPLGTKVYVEGYGYAVAADTGGAINGKKIDVFFSSKQQAYSWGRRSVLVKILD
jgi:uncharacterized protein YabE (DUF348 family)